MEPANWLSSSRLVGSGGQRPIRSEGDRDILRNSALSVQVGGENSPHMVSVTFTVTTYDPGRQRA